MQYIKKFSELLLPESIKKEKKIIDAIKQYIESLDRGFLDKKLQDVWPSRLCALAMKGLSYIFCAYLHNLQ